MDDLDLMVEALRLYKKAKEAERYQFHEEAEKLRKKAHQTTEILRNQLGI